MPVEHEDTFPHLDSTTSGPTLHEIKQKSSVESWRKIRTEMRQAVIATSGMPVNQLCIECHQDEATYRCVQCSAWTFYCSTCFGQAHSSKNIFHTGEVWEVVHSKSTCRQNYCELIAIGWYV